MTLLHFMVNQLFCLTQSAGSASQPAQISRGGVWRAAAREFGQREREEAEDKREKKKTQKTNGTDL